MEPDPRRIIYYQDARGREPFGAWLHRLDVRAQAAVQRRILRVSLGLFGDAKWLGGGVHELRLDLGAGYRVYFGFDGDTLVVLLCGGDKGTQRDDMARAKALWHDYLEHRP